MVNREQKVEVGDPTFWEGKEQRMMIVVYKLT